MKNECWEWQRGATREGYGLFYHKGKVKRVNRIAWLIAYGKIPKGYHICHFCDNPKCFNPDHLFLGTPKDNALDRESKNRGNQAKGSNTFRAKLTENQVIEIREKYKTGKYTHYSLADEYNITRAGIGEIINRRNWKHV